MGSDEQKLPLPLPIGDGAQRENVMGQVEKVGGSEKDSLQNVGFFVIKE